MDALFLFLWRSLQRNWRVMLSLAILFLVLHHTIPPEAPRIFFTSVAVIYGLYNLGKAIRHRTHYARFAYPVLHVHQPGLDTKRPPGEASITSIYDIERRDYPEYDFIWDKRWDDLDITWMWRTHAILYLAVIALLASIFELVMLLNHYPVLGTVVKL